jgi:hypothetical protein
MLLQAHGSVEAPGLLVGQADRWAALGAAQSRYWQLKLSTSLSMRWRRVMLRRTAGIITPDMLASEAERGPSPARGSTLGGTGAAGGAAAEAADSARRGASSLPGERGESAAERRACGRLLHLTGSRHPPPTFAAASLLPLPCLQAAHKSHAWRQPPLLRSHTQAQASAATWPPGLQAGEHAELRGGSAPRTTATTPSCLSGPCAAGSSRIGARPGASGLASPDTEAELEASGLPGA